MDRESALESGGVSRRTLLAGATTGLTVATSGCVRQVRSVVNRDTVDHLSVSIATVPADGDRESVQIANLLADNLEAVGIDASVNLLAEEEFLRAILVNHDFDLYVGQHPGGIDPDFLYETLHSVYADEPGWQNPFGFTSMTFDDLLERQRVLEGDRRREVIERIADSVAAEQPFVPVCVPDENRLVREDRFDDWDDHLATRLGYLGLEPLDGDEELRGIITDVRPTQNLNPLSVEYRNRGTIVNFVYDSLGTVDGNEVRPWLAASWKWNGSAATVTIRDDVQWHDGEPLTAADVRFTYRLLEDTSLGDSDVPAPSPRYRGQSSIVDSNAIEVHDERTLTIPMTGSQNVRERAFTVPILPKHVWTDRTGSATVPGLPVEQATTTAVVAENVPPIGSGPFQFADRTGREYILLERFDEHFSRADDELPEATVETFRVAVHPGSPSAIEAIESGNADVTISTLEAYSVDEVAESESVRLLESSSQTFYHVGFNVRNAPFSNPYFRRVVARLLDKERIVDELFDGHASPVATPLAGEWVPDHLEWDGDDPSVPFFGADGQLDESAARTAFEEAGFRYDDDGKLLARY